MSKMKWLQIEDGACGGSWHQEKVDERTFPYLEATPARLAADELVTALNGCLVALKLGAHVNQKSAIEYGMEVLAKAKPGGGNG